MVWLCPEKGQWIYYTKEVKDGAGKEEDPREN